MIERTLTVIVQVFVSIISHVEKYVANIATDFVSKLFVILN